LTLIFARFAVAAVFERRQASKRGSSSLILTRAPGRKPEGAQEVY